MDQHEPTWSEKETKREPKATKMEPKGTKSAQEFNKTTKKKSEKVGSRSVPVGTNPGFCRYLHENVGQRVPFLKSQKSKMAPKSNFSVNIGTGTLQKGTPRAVLRKHEKTMKNRSENERFF